MVGYRHNFLISNQKGAKLQVYSTQYPYTASEQVLGHFLGQATQPVVHLRPVGFHRSFYQFHLFEHSSVHQHSFRPEREPTPILHVYGIKQASMVQPVASIMEYDSNSGNGWPFVGRLG